jgi:hypothetical protein
MSTQGKRIDVHDMTIHSTLLPDTTQDLSELIAQNIPEGQRYTVIQSKSGIGSIIGDQSFFLTFAQIE